ncbi:MAG: hypothetical protein DME76_11390 [Verrucomicrobia bacterium]|nr:MAG: hypothetical protein DME76_11390 [Verrucomicrobiota bacterium]
MDEYGIGFSPLCAPRLFNKDTCPVADRNVGHSSTRNRIPAWGTDPTIFDRRLNPMSPTEVWASLASLPELKAGRRHDMTAMGFCIGVLIFALIIGYFCQIGNFGVETDFFGAYAPQAENIIAGRL